MTYETLVQKLSPKIHGIARQLNRHYPSLDEQDLYQEALFHLWDRWKEGVLSDKTDSYVLQGCSFHMRNALRKIDRRRAVLVESLDISRFDMCDRDSMPGFRTFLLDEIREHLDTRENLVLSLAADGFTVREIGTRIGVSHVMVVKILKAIRDKCESFRGMLQEEAAASQSIS